MAVLQPDDLVHPWADDFRPSSDIAVAFKVWAAIRDSRFDIRGRFCEWLNIEICDESFPNCKIRWPEVILWVQPRHICVAALRALEIEVPQ